MEAAFDYNESFIQQDTIPVSPQATIDSIPRAKVDSNHSPVLFIPNQVNKPIESNTDSIRIVPDFYKVNPTRNSLVSSYQACFKADLMPNNICYIVKKEIVNEKSKVFIQDNSKVKSFTEKPFAITEKLRTNYDWVFLPLFLGLVFLAVVITLYRKYIGQFFERIVYHFSSSKNGKDKSIPFQSLTIILDLLFIVSFSILIDLVVRKLGLYTSPVKYEYIVFILVSAFLVVLRIFRWLVYRLTALLSNQKTFFADLFSNSTLYTRTLGVILLPCVFLIAYTTGIISTYLIYFSVFITVIFLIIRIIRLLRVFVVGGFSIFYFILYLCALEIAPLLIIWKEVISR